MKVGVTGAAGHLGGTICRVLIEMGHEVVAFIRNDDKALKGLPAKIVKGDVLNRDSLESFISQCDVLIHAASSIELSYKFNQTLYNINVTGTKNVLEIAKKFNISKIVYVSSIHVYRQKPYTESLDENRSFVLNNSVFYDQTKRDAHVLALEAATNGQDVVVVCPSAIIGPYDFKPSKLGTAIKDIYQEKFPALFKGGFDFVDVRDVAKGTIAALEKGRSGETYNLCGKYYTIKELSTFIFTVKKVRKNLIALPLFLAYLGLPFVSIFSFVTKTVPLYDKLYLDILKDGNKLISSEKATKELNYHPRGISETLSDTIEWFKNQQKL